MSKLIGRLVIVLAFGWAGLAQASLITSPFAGTVVDFSQFQPGYYHLNGGSVAVGTLVGENIDFLSSFPNAAIVNDSYGLGSNGGWYIGRDGYVGLNASYTSGDYIQFNFNSGPVSAVGGFVNYAPDWEEQNYIIEALGFGNIVLETYDISQLAPISTPGQGDMGAFRGISRVGADIFSFRLYNSVNVLDDLTFNRTISPVPTPATLPLMALGLAALGYSRRKCKQQI